MRDQDGQENDFNCYLGIQKMRCTFYGRNTESQRCIYQIQSCFAVSEFYVLPFISPECDSSEGSIT